MKEGGKKRRVEKGVSDIEIGGRVGGREGGAGRQQGGRQTSRQGVGAGARRGDREEPDAKRKRSDLAPPLCGLSGKVSAGAGLNHDRRIPLSGICRERADVNNWIR